jgi:hypothetical protein
MKTIQTLFFLLVIFLICITKQGTSQILTNYRSNPLYCDSSFNPARCYGSSLSNSGLKSGNGQILIYKGRSQADLLRMSFRHNEVLKFTKTFNGYLDYIAPYIRIQKYTNERGILASRRWINSYGISSIYLLVIDTLGNMDTLSKVMENDRDAFLDFMAPAPMGDGWIIGGKTRYQPQQAWLCRINQDGTERWRKYYSATNFPTFDCGALNALYQPARPNSPRSTPFWNVFVSFGNSVWEVKFDDISGLLISEESLFNTNQGRRVDDIYVTPMQNGGIACMYEPANVIVFDSARTEYFRRTIDYDIYAPVLIEQGGDLICGVGNGILRLTPRGDTVWAVDTYNNTPNPRRLVTNTSMFDGMGGAWMFGSNSTTIQLVHVSGTGLPWEPDYMLTSTTTSPKKDILRVVPNPSKGNFTISGLSKPAPAIVHDALGRTIWQGTAQPALPLAQDIRLAAGIYILTLQGHTQHLRVVVE